jgi:hypothetical protein
VRLAPLLLVAALSSATSALAQPSAPPGPPPRDARPTLQGTGIIRGRLVDQATGSPIRAARVSLSTGMSAGDAVFTDDRGLFQFTMLAPGRYVLSAEKTGFAKTRLGARNDLEPPIPIAVANGSIVDAADIAMPKGASITGRVVDELGDPIAGALINLGLLQRSGNEITFVNAAPSTTTDDRGNYRLGGLSAGRYVVMLNGAVNGWAPNGLPDWKTPIGWVKTYYHDAATLAAATPLALAPGEERNGVDFALIAARPAKVTFSLTDASGNPIGGMINLMQRTDAGLSRNMAVPLSPTNTKMTPSLDPGEWTAFVLGGGPNVHGFARLTFASGEETSFTMVAAPGARMSGRVIFNGSTPAPAPGRISLRLRGYNDTPATSTPIPVKQDGTFEVGQLVGTLALQPAAAIPGWTLEAVKIGDRDLLDDPVVLAGTESVTDVQVIFTDRLAALTGTTVDEGGRPAPGCSIVVLPERGELQSSSDRARLQRSDQNGRFVLTDLRTGTYVAAAIANVDATSWLTPDYRDRLRAIASPITIAEHEDKTATLVCTTPR